MLWPALTLQPPLQIHHELHALVRVDSKRTVRKTRIMITPSRVVRKGLVGFDEVGGLSVRRTERTLHCYNSRQSVVNNAKTIRRGLLAL
jgi:hypothetical protein